MSYHCRLLDIMKADRVWSTTIRFVFQTPWKLFIAIFKALDTIWWLNVALATILSNCWILLCCVDLLLHLMRCIICSKSVSCKLSLPSFLVSPWNRYKSHQLLHLVRIVTMDFSNTNQGIFRRSMFVCLDGSPVCHISDLTRSLTSCTLCLYHVLCCYYYHCHWCTT